MPEPCYDEFATPASIFSDVTLGQAVELSAQLGIYAYDAFIIACALNHRAPIVTLDGGLATRARELKLEVPEVHVQ